MSLKVFDNPHMCIICGSYRNKYTETFWKCPECGHVTDELPPDINIITDPKYEQGYVELTEGKAVKQAQRWGLVLRHASDQKTLLDFGAGQNHFLKTAPEGHNFSSLTAFDVNWRTGLYDERVLDESYDVLTLWHTLEHLPDPRALLQRIEHKYLFLVIPWIEYLREEDWPVWPHFAHGMHLQFFTRKSLMRLLEDYEILEENYEEDKYTYPEEARKWLVGIGAAHGRHK
jgi:hypothetical protein